MNETSTNNLINGLLDLGINHEQISAIEALQRRDDSYEESVEISDRLQQLNLTQEETKAVESLLLPKNISLYPSTIFHFTGKLENLVGIINSKGFNAYYSKEGFSGSDNATPRYYTPMVSFCDLKISETKSQIAKYGSYGIGLSKAWGKSKGLNPVLYFESNSQLASKFISSLERFYELLVSLRIEQPIVPPHYPTEVATWVDNEYKKLLNYEDAIKDHQDLLSVYCYIKNYEGDLKRQGKPLVKNYRFADEREWRYVPRLDMEHLLSKDRSTQSTDLLDFSADDIRYIIIKNENEQDRLIKHITSAFHNDTPRLINRILTVEQINEDI